MKTPEMNKVHHDEAGQRFYTINQDKESILEYEKESPEIWSYVSTEVPEEQRGQGLGSELIKGALNYAKENGIQVNPVCSAVRSYIERHTEYNDLVLRDK